MIRKFAYLMALAREGHFRRAALACNVSQPTLSNAIRQLEQELGVPLVIRGRTFQGLTPEGAKVLEYARRILAECTGLQQELGTFGTGLAGTLRIGVIPTALPAVALLMAPFCRRHPRVKTQVLSLTSREIQQGLERFDLDAGITYLDNEPLAGVRTAPLFSERYFLLTPRQGRFAGRKSASWAEAAELDHCLLTPDMQNRRIIDAAFRMVDHPVHPAIETNSLITLYATVRYGPWCSIVPGQLLALFPPDQSIAALPLTTPEVVYTIGLVYADRSPAVPTAQALAAVVRQDRVAARIDQMSRDALLRAGIPVPE